MHRHHAAIAIALLRLNGLLFLDETAVRTILDLDEDILLAAKELAQRRQLSLGKALSELARRAMTQQDDAPTRHGVPLFPVRAEAYVVTFERVNQLRDEIL